MRYGNIQLGRYDRLFDPKDVQYFTKFINANGLLDINYGFWREHFVKDSAPTPTQTNGAASFTTVNIERIADPMADFTTPLADTTQIDKAGWGAVTDTIPDISKGFSMTTAERLHWEKLFQEFGNDADIVSQYVDNLQVLYNTVNARTSNMAAQLLSTWGINTTNDANGKGMGLSYIGNPYGQYVKNYTAGVKVWSDPTAKLIDQIVVLVEKYRDDTKFEGAIEMLVPEETIKSVFLTNDQIRTTVLQYVYSLGGIYIENGTPPTRTIRMDEFIKYTESMESLLPRIRMVKESQTTQTLTGFTKVKGWDLTKVVLKPIGLAGVIKYTEILDVVVAQKYPSPDSLKTTSYLDGGIFGVVNTIVGKGGKPEWHTDIFGSLKPALTEFMYHRPIDITTAG